MTGRRSGRKLRSDFNLGGEQAEADPLLQEAFYESGDYLAIESDLDPRCFIIARTGSGKSAALHKLKERYAEKVIRITPEDLSLPYITDLGVIRHLDSLGVHLDLLFIALWKHVLLVELIRQRYKVDSPAAKQNFLQNLKEQVKRDPAKQAALDYLNEFEGKFWCEADERVREITQQFERRIDAEAKAGLQLPGVGQASGGSGTGTSYSTEVRAEQARRFQRIVNDTQLARLNKMLNVLDEDILDKPQNFTWVIIDDLDRDWVDERLVNSLIRCLFRTVLDLKRVRHLKVLVALRTNIFEQLDFSERSGGQEEKFRSLILKMRWAREDLEYMLDERARTAGNRGELIISDVRDLLPHRNRTRGDPLDYILDRTLLRPRDAIAFVNECLSLVGGRGRISWNIIHAAERSYSEKRLLALRDEWKLSYPGIESVFDIFRRASSPLSRDEVTKYLDDIMLLLADRDFRGVVWLTKLSKQMWDAGPGEHDWFDLYQPVAGLLFKLGFLGCAPSRGRKPIYVYDDVNFSDRPDNLSPAASFHIHRAFHAALDITFRSGRSDSEPNS
jgi:hypothetical protein